MKKICLKILGIVVFAIAFYIDRSAVTSKTCSYEPHSDKPNPPGMQGYITIAQEDSDAVVVYENFPVNMADKVAFYDQQELIFERTNVEEARKLLLVHPEYYAKLVGEKLPNGFTPINAVLTCQ